MSRLLVVLIIAGLTTLTRPASASEVVIDFTIGNAVSGNFAYSLLHTADNAQGNGTALYRIVGSFSAVFDDVANTVTFVDFNADLYDGISVSNPGQLGSLVGTLDLASGLLNHNPVDDITSGELNLNMTLGSTTELLTFQFQPIQYTGIANTFNPDTLLLGLWGATPNVFGGEWTGTQLGIDLVGEGVIVPLPAALPLGLLGLGMVALVRRRSLKPTVV